MNLVGRHFLTLKDYSAEEISYLLRLAATLKAKKKKGELVDIHRGKNIALIFEKTSTRTRCAFEVAAYDLGMHVTYLGPTGSQMGKKETIKDTARVLSSMYDGIEYRGFGQDIVEEIAENSSVPVWNGLTNEFHPTQMLADFMTIKEHFGTLKGKKLVFCGDARNNVGNSLMVTCSKLGVDFICCAPKELWPSDELFNKCKVFAEENKSKIVFEEDIMRATFMADVIYTDVWVSMGESDSVWEERIKLLSPYQVNKKVMDNAKNNAIFLHCLPSFHNIDTQIGKSIYEKYGITEMEVTDEVFESSQSKVFEEAENRLHTIKAVMCATLYKGVIK